MLNYLRELFGRREWNWKRTTHLKRSNFLGRFYFELSVAIKSIQLVSLCPAEWRFIQPIATFHRSYHMSFRFSSLLSFSKNFPLRKILKISPHPTLIHQTRAFTVLSVYFSSSLNNYWNSASFLSWNSWKLEKNSIGKLSRKIYVCVGWQTWMKALPKA